MRSIYTECVVSLSPDSEPSHGTIYDAEAAIIRVCDDAAGPFLMIAGRSDYTEGGHDARHSFALNSAAEIDEFAAICRAFLAQAE